MVSAIHQHESAIGIHMSPTSWTSLPPPTLFYSSTLSQSTGFELPASYSKFSLDLYFTYGKIWTINKAERWRIDAFELWCWRRLLKVPWDCKEIQPDHPKGNQSWIFIGRTDAEVEAPILWSPDAKSQLVGKNHDTRKYWRQDEKGTTADEMVGWDHQFSGCEFEQTPGDGDGQESLACCSPWCHKEFDTTEWLNNKNIFNHTTLQMTTNRAS